MLCILITMTGRPLPHSRSSVFAQVYAATLCGFLIVDEPALREEAAAMLRGRTLEPLVSAIQRMLHFYVNTGSIVQKAEARLRELVDALSGSAAEGDEQAPDTA